jgi:hypothetical protein
MGLFDFLKKDNASDDTEDEAEECVLLEDIDEVLLEDGEYSYENYDKVCCPECGAYLGEGVRVCPECGHGKETRSSCPFCGKPLDEDDDIGFCPYCNNVLENEE